MPLCGRGVRGRAGGRAGAAPVSLRARAEASCLATREHSRCFPLQAAVAGLLGEYVARLSEVAGSLITCGPVLNWLELDNRGHRLIVTDDSDINTPAVAAAYVVKRYTAQASDEISFEVSTTRLWLSLYVSIASVSCISFVPLFFLFFTWSRSSYSSSFSSSFSGELVSHPGFAVYPVLE